MTEQNIAARKQMLNQLADDLTYEGWGDLPCKFWMVLGDVDDPYVEYVGSFHMDPGHWLMHRCEEGVLGDHILGLTICWDSWQYPDSVGDSIDKHNTTNGSMAGLALEAYSALVAPDEHPDHSNVRTAVSVFRDGVVLRAVRSDKGVNEIKRMNGIPPTGLVGDDIVNKLRVLLGIAEPPTNALRYLANLQDDATYQDIVQRSKEENWSAEKIAAEIFKHAPPDIQQELAPTMPDDVRRELER